MVRNLVLSAAACIGLLAPPRRIVSLDPTMTELLFAIGAGDRLVGRSHYDLHPDSATRAVDLGPALRPNVEAVIATRPDLVLLYDNADNRDAVEKLRAFGIPTLLMRVDRLERTRCPSDPFSFKPGDVPSSRSAAIIS